MGRRTSRRRASGAREPDWVDLPDDDLLELRFCDLGLSLPGTWLEPLVARVHDELADRGLRFRPHVWLSNEWFSPDGVPGVAIPFYLAHPRLMRLERAQVLEVEGGTKLECLKILRHEVGHAIDTAWNLRRRRSWAATFGRAGTPYPDTYRPRPRSRNFVLHLDQWYAQSHPVEDFAETFAVWLTPGMRWRSRYAGWPALTKLRWVDRVMGDLAGETPRVRSRRFVDPVRTMRMTLGEHYALKRERYGVDTADFHDLHLHRIFVRTDARTRRHPKAESFLRKEAPALRRLVSQATGYPAYTVDQFLREMILRCRARGLRVVQPLRQARLETGVLLTAIVMGTLARGGFRVTL